MIIFVDGFDKSGRTTLAKQVAHDLSFDKAEHSNRLHTNGTIRFGI